VLLCAGGVVAAIAIGDRELLCGDFGSLMPAAVCAGVCAHAVRYKRTHGQISQGRFVLHMHVSSFDWCMFANRISLRWAGSSMTCKHLWTGSSTKCEYLSRVFGHWGGRDGSAPPRDVAAPSFADLFV
jgi:hypothetical protein